MHSYFYKDVKAKHPEVLILVLMEDALVRKRTRQQLPTGFGLNPCFNGRCTRTYVISGILDAGEGS